MKVPLAFPLRLHRPKQPHQTMGGRSRLGMPRLRQCFSVHKAGNALHECEDAYAWWAGERGWVVAIADGATESSFARQWAQILVETYVRRPTQDLSSDWLYPLQQHWAQWLDAQQLRWYARRKAQEGTFATLLGLVLLRDRQWRAIAVGDSCLFVVRQQRVMACFPITNGQLLGFRPPLLSSQGQQPPLIVPARSLCGVGRLGDRFYLVTDALAAWIFSQLELGNNPWQQLNQIRNSRQFCQWVDGERSLQRLPNDDTTLICLELRS
ncbi:MAG: protein phosphatase 2C domain-containing protein [Oscillatoriales cyanobacterium SM2_2_1]|nr:protein phosphatase 2C domain-containing protein [Oscillatoriales cyanobacterium SM2_2_1]